jgi:hypothetical protein
MIVTKDWIMQHRTDSGSWTRSQLNILDVRWPPAHGWIERSIGKELSDYKRTMFESKLTAQQDRKYQRDFFAGDRTFEKKRAAALRKHSENQKIDETSSTEALDLQALAGARRAL